MLHEIDFNDKISLRTFHVVKGAREPECAVTNRPSHKDHKILHQKSYKFLPAIHQLYDLLILIQKGLAPIFPPPPSDSLNASPTKSASHHVIKAKKENEEVQQRDASMQ